MALLGVGLVAGACGGGSATPGVASLGSTTTTAVAAGSANPTPFQGLDQEYQYSLNFAACMRQHGLPGFPDPIRTSRNLTFNASADSSSPQFTSADNACKHLLPNDGGPPTATQVAAETAKLLKYAECMRAHGVPNFSDPVVTSHSFGFSLQGVDVNSPQFKAAQLTCKQFSIAGG